MPYSKDIRCGWGFFDLNVNWFYDYLDRIGEELIVKTDCDGYSSHNELIEEMIENRANEFIDWVVFHQERKKDFENDDLPSEWAKGHKDDIWAYIYYHISRFVKLKPTWYELKEVE